MIWVWSTHVAYEHWDLYYPGDEHVDWVAIGALNFGPIAQWSRWWTFAEIFGTKYPDWRHSASRSWSPSSDPSPVNWSVLSDSVATAAVRDAIRGWAPR